MHVNNKNTDKHAHTGLTFKRTKVTPIICIEARAVCEDPDNMLEKVAFD